MVASVRLAAGLSGLRNRNTRVTNKTQLRVVRGCIEADPIILDDEDGEKNRILASQGVDEEDANEHHLQAALWASSQRTLSAVHFNKTPNNSNNDSYIPTPDAAGLVAEYDTLYDAGKYKDSATHLRFSDSLDESCAGGLSGAFTYFLDDRDVEWLERNNGAARGEGTSTCGGLNGVQGPNGTNVPSSMSRNAPRAPHARSAKARGKEPEHRLPNGNHQPSIVIGEDHFELVMGLLEKWTDESVSPYLHLAYDPQHFPDFSDYEKLFSMPLVPVTFANFTVPPNLPPPEHMVQLAKAIYPWWKERRIEREGHRIVPQLNVLILEAQEKEDKSSGSPYICFRKRDVKPMRKTRTNNVVHTEKLSRLRAELQTSLDLAKMVLQREKLKGENAAASELVWRSRGALAEVMKQLNGAAPGSVPPGDELLLIDKEHKSRKKVEITTSSRVILTNRRISHARAGLSELLDPHSPLALNGDTSHLFELRQKGPSDRVAAIQREVDRELAKTRKDDVYWEDTVDIPHHHTSPSVIEKSFGPVLPPSSDNTNSTSSISSSTPSADPQWSSSRVWRTSRSARMRVGRGGRLHFDRRLHIPQPHRLLQREWAGFPPRTDDHIAAQQDAERWASRSWRPRHEAGGETRLRRKERQRGEDYWAHPSIYEAQGKLGAIDQTSAQPQDELQEQLVGFEQSGLGWDGHRHRGPWARVRAGRDEESWKPTPPFAGEAESLGGDVNMRDVAEGDRVVEVWRGGTNNDGGGGALALFMDGDTAGNEGGQDEISWDQGDFNDAHGQSVDTMDHAWKVEERWRFDFEGHPGQDAEDRFLLDDFQPKFMRTTITLLDAQDHEAVSMDPQLLAPPPLKQNRYLDHQLRSQHPGLPQHPAPEFTPVTTPKPPSHQMTLSSRPVASPSTIQSGIGAHAPLSLSPAQNLSPTMNGIANSSSARPLPSPNPPHGTNALGSAPSGARLPPDSSAATVRVSASVRTKHPPVSVTLPQGGIPSAFSPGSANGKGDTAPHGPYQLHTAPSYPSLKTPLGRVVTGQQDQGRIFQKPLPNNVNVANGNDIAAMNPPLGVNNVHLKLPSQRAAQLRARVNGEHHGAMPSTETPGTDHYALTSQLALPRLPAHGSHPA